ncbi:MAG: ferredoxin family protein [Eubacterium sp.]|nr:ferredoxin family protein [Eubacterium sp.]MBQ7200176.1 ferredoxin family protein [Eubacterium sp.]MBR0119630.1 ferredoxin family protein [Eubacterium sp.]
MSVFINTDKCTGCGKCTEVCPGNLIKLSGDKKAYLKHPQDCWGCTSCIKECEFSAIYFFLGADIGGRGSIMEVEKKGYISLWRIRHPDGKTEEICVDSRESNKY